MTQTVTVGRETRAVPYGTYSVVDDGGSHRTIRLEAADWAFDEPDGTITAKELAYDNRFRIFAFIRPDGTVRRTRTATASALAALHALLTGDYESMGLAYAVESGNCFVCGRTLTVPASVHRGMGPVCAQEFDRKPRFEFNRTVLAGLMQQMEVVTANGTPVQVQTLEPSVSLDGKRLSIGLNPAAARFGEWKLAVKQRGARYDGATRRWTFPDTIDHGNAIAFRTFLTRLGLPVPDGLATLAVEAEAMEERIAEAATAYEPLPDNDDGPFTVDGLVPGRELMPFQIAGVQHAVRARRTIIADQMGLGKTVTTLATIAHLGAFPALIVVPASLKLNWRREALRWVDGAEVHVLSGMRQNPTLPPLGPKAIVIVNYEILGGYSPATRSWSKGWGSALERIEWGMVVADEAHYLKNQQAKRTKAFARLAPHARDGVLLLTGTPVLNRPVELWPPLDILGYGKQRFGGFFAFAKRYCGATKGRFGWDFSGATNIEELHNILLGSGAMIRRTKDDVLTDLPPKRWALVPVDMGEHTGEYLRAEMDTIRWFSDEPSRRRKLVAKLGAEWDTTPSLQEQSRDAYIEAGLHGAYERSLRAEQLVRFEALKLAAWRAKEAAVIEWVENFLESGKKLVIFGHHTEVVDALAERFGAPKIQGGMTTGEIEAGKQRFQTDPDCRVIVCNLQAGGVGHTLTAASDVAFVEFPWTPALLDQAVDRTHRIGQTESVTGWLLTAAGEGISSTIDDDLLGLLERKRDIVDAVTDGRQPGERDFNVTEALAAAYATKAGK